MVTPRSPVARVDLTKVLGKSGFAAEIARLKREEKGSRDGNAHRILGTDVIRDKDVDAARLLMTTLGGYPRAITQDDLRQFDHNARKLGDRYKGGITAQGVIDASLAIDRQRANEQIRTAVVMRAHGGLLHFVTNAGPDSDVHRHHVNVMFPAFPSYATSAADPKKLARRLLNGPLQFECDCGRFRFWYRYLATKGRFVYGRQETGYPRIRNPKLVGVACKHGLRVMQAVLKDPNALIQASKMIAEAQAGQPKPVKLTAAQAKAVATEQLTQSGHLKHRAETTAERRGRIASTPAAKVRALKAAQREAEKRAEKERAKMQRTMQVGATKIEAILARDMGISDPKKLAQIMAAIKAAQGA